jgi:hypothetical protein
MEVGKLFASIGFRVDTKNLDTFETRLANTQVKLVGFANSIDSIGKHASQAAVPLNNLTKSLNFKGASTGIAPLSNALEKLSATLQKMDMSGFHSKLQRLTYALEEARPSIHRNANAWERYADAVTRAKMAVSGSWAMGGRAPKAPMFTGASPVAAMGGGGGYVSSPHYTPQSRLMAPLVGSHLAYLASSGVMAGVGAIYATKATLDRAQENVTAENFVKMASANDAEFEQNKKWLWDKSMYYGTDINANMEGFGKIYMNTSEALGRDRSLAVIEDIMKYNTAMHTSREAQKFINKSLYQMAGTAQVNAQDYNQWEEHVAGGQKVAGRALDILAEEKGGKFKDWRQYGTAKKAISEIQIEGKDLVPALTKAMAEASAKGLEVGRTGYQAEGSRFQNKVTGLARELADGGLFEMGKSFFKLLNSIMDILQKLMPLWSALAVTVGFFFENIANGIEYLSVFVTSMADFVHWIFTAGEETYALRGVLMALVVSTLPLVLAGIKKFMSAVTALMMRNPITAALIILLTVLGWLYGQWKRQQEGLSNWLDFFTAVLYIIKEAFLINFYAMKLAFFSFIGALMDGFASAKNFIGSVFDWLKNKFSFLGDIVTKLKEIANLSDEQDKKERDREVRYGSYGRPSPYKIPEFKEPRIPSNNALPASQIPFKLQGTDVRILDRDDRLLGTTTIQVAEAYA